MQKYIDKIPRTNEHLQEKVEAVEKFQKRRGNWILLNDDNKDMLSEWKIKRIAGIK